MLLYGQSKNRYGEVKVKMSKIRCSLLNSRFLFGPWIKKSEMDFYP